MGVRQPALCHERGPRAGVLLSASLPSGYVEVDRWDIGRVPSWLVAVSLVLALVALLVTANVALAVLYLTSGVAGFSLGLTSVLFGTLLGLVLHELSHAAGFLLLGGRPRFGWRARTRLGPILYVCAPGSYFSRGGYLFAGIGAVGVLTVLLLGVVAIAPPGGAISATAIVAASLNVAGAAGDAIISRAVLSHPSGARFEDTGEGFIVYDAAAAREPA